MENDEKHREATVTLAGLAVLFLLMGIVNDVVDGSVIPGLGVIALLVLAVAIMAILMLPLFFKRGK